MDRMHRHYAAQLNSLGLLVARTLWLKEYCQGLSMWATTFPRIRKQQTVTKTRALLEKVCFFFLK